MEASAVTTADGARGSGASLIYVFYALSRGTTDREVRRSLSETRLSSKFK